MPDITSPADLRKFLLKRLTQVGSQRLGTVAVAGREEERSAETSSAPEEPRPGPVQGEQAKGDTAEIRFPPGRGQRVSCILDDTGEKHSENSPLEVLPEQLDVLVS